jgi:phosphoribosylanthranilate isomerase
VTASSATRIKICGITRVADAIAVAESGADTLGLNFVGTSSRKVDVGLAAEIAAEVAERLCIVALFVEPEADLVREVLDRVPVDLLQFHGEETDSFCVSFGVPYMKAHRVRSPVEIAKLKEAYPHASWHLLDAFVAGQTGGTGQRFDWHFWPDAAGNADDKVPLALAGGLTPENVGKAVRRLHPDAVDVSGGVEGPVKGEKDPARIRAFVEAVRMAERK